MSEYRKKPVVIAAIQWTEEPDSFGNIDAMAPGEVTGPYYDQHDFCGLGYLKVKTNEGVMRCEPYDWIIKEPFPTTDRRVYPCKPDIFALTYEPAVPPDPHEEGGDVNGRRIEETRLILQNLYDGLEGVDRDMVGVVVSDWDVLTAENARLVALVQEKERECEGLREFLVDLHYDTRAEGQMADCAVHDAVFAKLRQQGGRSDRRNGES